jgi:hypothetical protein
MVIATTVSPLTSRHAPTLRLLVRRTARRWQRRALRWGDGRSV